MGDECQGREANADELQQMRRVVGEAIEAGAIGLSVSRNRGHFDPQGVLIPAIWASEEELFALGDELREAGTGIIQCGGGRVAEIKDRMCSRLSQATGRQVVYNNLGQTARRPNEWKELMAVVDETSAAGIRSYPLCSPNSTTQSFTMRNCQLFRGIPTWHPILLSPDEEKLQAYSNPKIRAKLHAETVEWSVPATDANIAPNWYEYLWVDQPVLEKNKGLKGKTIAQISREQGKGYIDTFLDLVVEENLDTGFLQGENNVDIEAVTKILNYPNAIVGLSDGGAHVQFHGGYGYSTRLLGYWVREQNIMSLETAIRRLTFESASAFGIFDRGLLRPGMAADIVTFDPDTVQPLPEDVVHDFPAGGWRIRELAQGIKHTIVNGEVVMEDGEATGALPGHVVRNAMYNNR
jgi:N-acyl-D-aspartate/D-glutamate deacylase